MRFLMPIILLALAAPALASPYFPLVPGAVWTLTDDDPPASTTLAFAGTTTFHGAVCYPRYETIVDGLVGVSYWSVDADGRVLLHGLVYQLGEDWEFYFNPPAVYFDPDLACGESTDYDVNVYEVTEFGDQWRGERILRLSCIDRDPVTTPLGTFGAVTVDPVWVDSPGGAAWRYGHDGIFSYGFGVGPVRITSKVTSEELLLVALENFVPTAAPVAPVAALSLRAAPNPFNPVTTLSFELPTAAAAARLDIFDLAGRRVATLHEGSLPAGRNTFTWRPGNLGSGLYLARLTSNLGVATTRLTLVE